MATAETVLAIYSGTFLGQKNKALESRMRSKDSCPVWGEGIGKVLPTRGSNSPVSYATLCTVLGEPKGETPLGYSPKRCIEAPSPRADNGSVSGRYGQKVIRGSSFRAGFFTPQFSHERQGDFLSIEV